MGFRTILATVTAAPLVPLNDVTVALSCVPAAGRFRRATVSVVAVAAVTTPVAPPDNRTSLVKFAGSNPVPRIVSVLAPRARDATSTVTAGASTTVATPTASPLIRPLVVTVAESVPAAEGFCVNCTTSVFAVAKTTLPVTPPSNATTLRPGRGSKPVPRIEIRSADRARAASADDTVGAATTACTRYV